MKSRPLQTLFSASSGGAEIKPLTGVRGVAAFIVMIYHYCNYVAFPQFHPDFLSKGYLCVDLFFVLSGFVLALRYGEKLADRPSASAYGTFIEARIARIYPAYIFISILYYAKWVFNISGSNTAAYRSVDFVANILLIQGWGFPVRSLVPDAWSVSVEFFPYIIFPVLAAITLGKRLAPALLVGLCALGVLDAIVLSGSGVSGPLDVVGRGPPIFPLLRCLAGFSLGLLTFRVVNGREVRTLLSASGATAVALGLLCLSLWLDRSDVFTVCLFPVLVACLYFNARLPKALFGNRLIHHLGDISFSMYLLHPFFIGVAGHFAMKYAPRFGHRADLVFIALGVGATWAASYVAYRLVELPGRRLLRALGPERRAATMA